jgi:hypothetical protein
MTNRTLSEDSSANVGAAQRKAARRTALVLGLIAAAFYASIFVAQMLRNAG